MTAETKRIVDSSDLVLREREKDQSKLHSESDQLRHTFSILREDEGALEAEIRAASHHTNTLNGQNRTLGDMLDSYARGKIPVSPYR